MERYVGDRILVALTIGSLCLMGYTVTYALADADPEYDMTIDNIPINFDNDKTLYLDTQTNDRAFIIFDDYLQIRSSHLTFYDLNNSFPHEDINLIIGEYAYTPSIPAQNATLDSIRPIDRFEFWAWNGTVSVQCSEYGASRMTLEVNSTDNATIIIRCLDLHPNYDFRVIIDGEPLGYLRVNYARYMEYNYSGDWSNHTITFVQVGQAFEVPASSLLMIELMLCLGVVIGVFGKMVMPLVTTKSTINNKVLFETVRDAVIYIVISLTLIGLVFKLFVGV